MATTWNVADATTRSGRWFHSFDFTNTAANVVEPLKVKDATQQIFYVEEIGFWCISSLGSSKLAIFDSSLAGGVKKITGLCYKRDGGRFGEFKFDFNNDPLVFNSDTSAGSSICVSCGGVGAMVYGFSGYIKGYTGV